MGNAPAREGLVRSVPFRMVRAADDNTGDGLTLTGYAAVFDTPTEIDSWEGTFIEKIRRGAFRKSIRERTPVLQFDHGHHPLIGSIPIGKIRELREDDGGLFVSGRLSDNWLIEPVRDAIRDEAVEGMSFRFSVVREEWRDKNGKLIKDPHELMELLWSPGDRGPLERTLIELKVPELGPVVFPAYVETSVGVRARSLATRISNNAELRRDVVAALAREAPATEPDTDDLTDPQTRREVARALLFQAPDAPPPDGHPSDSEPRSDAGLSHADAAPPDGHPVEANDAPPPDGHPSPPLTTSDDRMVSDISEVRALMREVIASIPKGT